MSSHFSLSSLKYLKVDAKLPKYYYSFPINSKNDNFQAFKIVFSEKNLEMRIVKV